MKTCNTVLEAMDIKKLWLCTSQTDSPTVCYQFSGKLLSQIELIVLSI